MKRSQTIPLADRLAALSDQTRLRIVRLAETCELSVGEIARVVQLPQSTVSRHLKTLSETGWLVRRSEGTASLYALTQDDLPEESRPLWQALRGPLHEDGEWQEDQKRLRSVLAERRTDSLSFFGRVGGEWDAVRTELFGGRFTSLALLGLVQRSWRVADVGCGTGNAAELLAPFVERVYAVDLSQAMLDAARTRLADQGNITFVQAPADATGLPDASVDAVVCVLALHHLEDPARAVRELTRVLRTTQGGGKALIVDMVAHTRDEYRRTMGHKHLGFSRESMSRMLEEAGLTDITYHELPGEAEAKGPALFVATGEKKRGSD
jgi:ArsR family transcriptional regulator